MKAKKIHEGKKVWSKKAGMLLTVNEENYLLLKESHKNMYDTAKKKPEHKDSTNTSGETDSK